MTEAVFQNRFGSENNDKPRTLCCRRSGKTNGVCAVFRLFGRRGTADGVGQGVHRLQCENASYGATLCAERTAFAKAIGDGERAFVALAVAGGAAGEIHGGFPPCGVCRQVMAEFCCPDFTVLVVTGADGHREYRLAELLPYAFDADTMA